jgi:putative heme-binding domain-containing protein
VPWLNRQATDTEYRKAELMGSRKYCLIAMMVVACITLNGQAQTRPAWTRSRIKGSPTPPSQYKIVPAFPGLKFNRPTSLEEFPSHDRILVTEMGGRVLSFVKSATVKEASVVLDLEALAGKRLWSATLHPNFAENRFMFVCCVHKTDVGEETQVTRFKLTKNDPPKAISDSGRVVIRWPAGGHNGGCMRFGKDGMLYISTGDGSGPNPPDGRTTGQDISDLMGAVLRINVDVAGDKEYSVPKDNPFVDTKDARPEIWAYGLRNPWKFGIDSESGSIFLADNGWESWEMVHKIVKGGNCGWPVMEGRASLRPEVKVGPTPIIPPVKDHSHTEANSVIGGPIYRGAKLPELDGTFVYGDYITGTIWGLNTSGEYAHSTLVDTDLRIVDFASGSQGELYVLDFDLTEQIYELVPSGLKDTSANFPRKLSQTGIFRSLETLKPEPGVEEYRVTVPRWMDGARATRWFGIPSFAEAPIATVKDGPLQMPEGSVFVKHIEISTSKRTVVRLETQILHFEHGVWNPYSYLWNDAGTDADLVDSQGANRQLEVRDDHVASGKSQRTWHTSSVNECRLCHNAGSNYILGFRPAQLGLTQIRRLEDGLVAKATKAAKNVVPLVNTMDKTKPLNDRARSYLHANCSSCHNPRGNAIVSFYLRADMPFDALNTNKGTGIGTFGMRNAKIIVPGDPYRSVLMYRMSKLGYARMPYIGSQVVDSAGVELIEKWIGSLPAGDNAATNSGPATNGSVDSKSLAALANSVSANDRGLAIKQLMKTTEGSLALMAQMHAGAIKEPDFLNAATTGSKASSSDIGGLFETFVPENQRRKRLGPNPNPQSILALKGDLARGKLIFHSDGARCRNCHDVNDAAKSLGPTLLEINKKYPRRNEMLQHALQPSLKIDDKFAAFVVITDRGRSFTGLLVEKTAEQVTLKTFERKVITIKASKIDVMKKSAKSLMPDRILSDLTAQEAADLIAYLGSVGKAP